VPEALRDARVVALDLAGMLAGASTAASSSSA
jgi:ATP-dependent Clp protease ATP-binding subunit ClpA